MRRSPAPLLRAIGAHIRARAANGTGRRIGAGRRAGRMPRADVRCAAGAKKNPRRSGGGLALAGRAGGEIRRGRQRARRGAAAFSRRRSISAGSLTLARKIIAAMMYGLKEASR